jgi:hypothetical protein
VFADMTDTSFLHGNGRKEGMAAFMWDACGKRSAPRGGVFGAATSFNRF